MLGTAALAAGGKVAKTGGGPGFPSIPHLSGFSQDLHPSDGLKRKDRAHDKSRLLFHDRVVDRGAEAFVQDLAIGDLGGGGGAILVGGGDGDVEGHDLVGVPGQSHFLEARDFRQGNGIEIRHGGVDLALNGNTPLAAAPFRRARLRKQLIHIAKSTMKGGYKQ